MIFKQFHYGGYIRMWDLRQEETEAGISVTMHKKYVSSGIIAFIQTCWRGCFLHLYHIFPFYLKGMLCQKKWDSTCATAERCRWSSDCHVSTPHWNCQCSHRRRGGSILGGGSPPPRWGRPIRGSGSSMSFLHGPGSTHNRCDQTRRRCLHTMWRSVVVNTIQAEAARLCWRLKKRTDQSLNG